MLLVCVDLLCILYICMYVHMCLYIFRCVYYVYIFCECDGEEYTLGKKGRGISGIC